MRKNNQVEEMWYRIKGKHLDLLGKHQELGVKFKKTIADMGILMNKFHAVIDAGELLEATDIEGKSPEVIEMKRIEPMNSYFTDFVHRNKEFLHSKEFNDFADAINHTFVRRMNAVNVRIHSKPHSTDHIIKILIPYEKEIDALTALYPIFEKVQTDTIEEFEDIKRVAAFDTI